MKQEQCELPKCAKHTLIEQHTAVQSTRFQISTDETPPPSGTPLQVVVTMLKIERYTRSADGLLVQYDEASSSSTSGNSTSGNSLYTGISAATSDASGDWLASRILSVARSIHGWPGCSRLTPGLVQSVLHHLVNDGTLWLGVGRGGF